MRHGMPGHKWRFRKEAFGESDRELVNPVRGWYQIHTFLVEEEPPLGELAWSLNGTDTLALVFIDLGAYRERPLDDAALSHVEGILGFFAGKGMDIVLRLAYDHEGKAQEREPQSFQQVVAHVTQLGPILSDYASHIFVFQGLLVGSWGEMHTSRFLATSQLERLSYLLNDYLGEDTFLAVRRPYYWRLLHPEYCGRDGYSGTFTGLFDDAILGSDTDLGTFGPPSQGEGVGWEEPWPTEQELSFEEILGRYAPQGGEAVYEEGASNRRPLRDSVRRLSRMGVTYLNRVHDERQLAVWGGQNWDKKDAYFGMSGLDYIGRHLGYRFCVRHVSMAAPSGDRGACLFEVEIANVGFARIYQEAIAWLEWDAEDGPHRQELDFGLGEILPGEARVGSCLVEPCLGPIYLVAARKRDGRAIYFANGQENPRGILLGTLSQ